MKSDKYVAYVSTYTSGMKDNIHYEILEGLEDDDRVVIGNDIESAEAKSMLDAESRRKNRPPRF